MSQKFYLFILSFMWWSYLESKNDDVYGFYLLLREH